MQRNLQEQVLYLSEELEKIKQSLGTALPDPIEGPEGPEGPEGQRGAQGEQGFGIVGFGTQLPSSGRDGDWFLLKKSTMSGIDFVMCRCVLQHWVEQFSIRGPAGPIANATEVVANPETSPSDSLTKIKVDGVTYAISEVEANPDSSYDHLGLTTAAINGTTYFVGGVWAKYLSGLLYEDEGSVTCDGQFVATNSILVDSIASTVDQDTPVTISAITTTNEVTVGDDLTVGVNASVNNDLDVGNDLTVYGEIMVTDASSIVDENGDPLIPGAISNMVTTDTDQIITGVKSFTSGMAIGDDVVMSGDLDLTGNISASGNISTGNDKKIESNRFDLIGNNNTIHFQSSSYTGNSKLHDDTQNKDTAINNLMDGHRVLVHNLRLIFNADANNTYPTGSRLGFQINASKSGYTSVSALNNEPSGLYQGIPAWFDFNDHDKPIQGILVDANFGSSGHLKFCYYDKTLGDYTVLDLLTANISSVWDTRTAQV